MKKYVAISLLITVSALIIPSYIAPGQRIILAPDPAVASTVDRATLEQAYQIIKQRIDAQAVLGWPKITVEGKTIIITGFFVAKNPDFADGLTRQGKIEMIDAGVEFPHLDGAPQIFTGDSADPDRSVYRILLGDADFVEANSLTSRTDSVELEITLSPEGAARLADFLARNQGIYLCLVQDNVAVGCPIIKLNETRLTIRQGPTDFLVDSTTLASQINAQALPVPLVILGPEH